MRSFSLRTKLLGAIGLAIMASSAPFVYYTYEDTLERSTAVAQEKFGKITSILEEDLSLSYLNGQTLITEKIEIEKTETLRELDQIETALSEGQLDGLESTLAFLQKSWGSHVLIVSESGQPLFSSHFTKTLLAPGLKDYLGVPFTQYTHLKETSVYRDLFTFVRLDNKMEGRSAVPYLVAVRKVGNKMVLILQDLSLLEAQEPKHMRSIEGHLIDTVRSMLISPETSFHVLTNQGVIVAGRGEETMSLAQLYLPAFRDKVREAGSFEGVYGEGGDRELYRVKYFSVLDWYIHASIPETMITEPAQASARNVIAMVAMVFGLVSLVGVFLISWFLRPLDRVSSTARTLEHFDFRQKTDAAGFAHLVEGMPVDQKDEIGDVSRAFSSMVVAIEKNIDELKTSLARQHGIEGELNAAQKIQLGMLPDATNGFVRPGITAAATMVPAKEVGGDFYDVFSLPDGREVLVLGDVSGKGVSAALFMCVTLTLLRNALGDGLSPAASMTKVNDQLAAKNPNCMFVTLWIGIYDPKTRVLTFANGGHPAPAVIPADKAADVRWLRELSGPLVGVFEETPFTQFETTLASGDVVYVYSDGVSEAMNLDKKLFAESGMNAVFARVHGVSAQGVIDEMMHAIVDYRGEAEQSDDITMLVFEGTETKEGEA